jgi:initiation factor 1A
MVKNITGGGGAKGLARKHQNQSDTTGRLRLPTDVLEQYACITKMLGNGMCEVFTDDNVRLIGHIRNKFRGRQKRHNMLSTSTIVLVGLRDWEKEAKNCDLLTHYDDNQVEQLRMIPNINIKHVLSLRDQKMLSKQSSIDDVTFETDTSEWEPMADDVVTSATSSAANFKLEQTDEVAFDDV